MRWTWVFLIAVAAALAGCDDHTTAPRDVTAPAAPRGLRSITGDHTAYLSWLQNTEADVAGYRIYQGSCGGTSCPYYHIGTTTGTSFAATGLVNGATTYFAVLAFDHAGNESPLSYDTVFDTPRPEGFGVRLASYLTDPTIAGWDFSAVRVRPWDDPATDILYGYDSNRSSAQMFVPDFQTDIQDAGYASDLDAVDFAPNGGWSPTGSVELIEGHCYVVWTRDDHYAKFRVTSFIAQSQGPPLVQFDWAYQVDPGNRELRARPARTAGEAGAGRRPITWVR